MSNTTDDLKAVEKIGITSYGVVKELRKVIVDMGVNGQGGVSIISCLKAYMKDA
jgi:hypothetical protein